MTRPLQIIGKNIARLLRQFQSAMSFLAIICYCYGPVAISGLLTFDPTAIIKDVLIPVDAAVGSVIYRLRGSDTAFDYPLRFSLKETTTVAVEALNCTRFNSVCQANLILKKKLEVDRFYDFKVEIQNQRGQVAVVNCSFRATNATTPVERIFPGAPTLLTVSENARRNSELGTIIAKGNPNRMKAVYMELYGSAQFGIHQRLISEKDAEGTIVLLNSLDYETKTVHHLTILANDPWSNIDEDTRNIAGWPVLVAVIDEQDTAPIFTIAPPTTILSSSLKPEDTILRVHAEDGDRGQPRPIRYSLDPKDPASSFFRISEKTGELSLALPLAEIITFSTQNQPILLKVTAEEVRSNPQEAPSQSTTVQLALIPPGITLGSPTFGAIEYHALLDENAPVGTTLDIPQAEITTEPGDVITLELAKNNGTFEIYPNVVERFSKFTISVHDNRLLDYEMRHYVECYIVAKEIGKGNYTANAKLTVVLNDINDNPPRFVKSEFIGTIPEHANIGTTVLIVEATDIDREPGSKIRYTDLIGPESKLFNLDEITGIITVTNSQELDAEINSKIFLEVQAQDDDGKGLTTTAKVTINLLDINDNAPQFDKDIYEFILNSDRNAFTSQAFIKAYDSDISPPNNEIRYQLLTPNNDLFLNEKTGEFLVKKMWDYDDLVIVQVRAYDEGVPRLYSNAEVRIYPPESKSRKMIFIVPGKYPDKISTEKTLSTLTGSRVVIDEIRPYNGFEPGATYVTRDQNAEKSVVAATVYYTKDSVVDVNRIQQILDSRNQEEIAKAQIQQTNQPAIIKEQKETTISKASSGDYLWLSILLIVLAIIAIIILILCCICRPCPLYIPPKRRRIDSGNMIEKLVVRGSGHGKESKSVQVAEWFGRKEAWSAEKEIIPVMVDTETDSMRRHEMERGSDKGEIRPGIRHQHLVQSQNMQNRQEPREQLYIREGNADILRLITRAGAEPQRNGTYFADQAQQHYFVDSGKDILMRRFIDQQQEQVARTQVLLPNAVNKLQSEQEFLEASLRQQNALLRQLILDRERDLRLETQSLPAGTQTDKDIGTQTEPQYLRPPRRRVQTDLELSDDGSDEEIAIIKARAKRRHRIMKPRKIKTPIQEESEVEIMEKYENAYKQKSLDKSIETKPAIKQTRTSQLREKRATSNSHSGRKSSISLSHSGLRREVLNEISASLNQSDEEKNDYRESGNKAYIDEDYSEDSSDDISPRSEETPYPGRYRYRSASSEPPGQRWRSKSRDNYNRKSYKRTKPHNSASNEHKHRYKSESDLRISRPIHHDSDQIEPHSKKKGSQKGKKQAAKGSSSRYMEWYTKSKQSESKQQKPKSFEPNIDNDKAVKQPLVESRLYKETVSSSNKKVDGSKTITVGPEHPLLQHSEHRFEIRYPKKRAEEDADSGIVLSKPEMAKKKSVFTIAYNDIHTSQLRPDTSINTP